MSIRFERVILENWLVYQGRVQIDFGEAPTEGKNIIVVHGLNGFGKTSLLRGVQWAFHDSLPDKDLKECFNKGAIRDGQRDLSVEIHFVDRGIRYQLIRRARARIDGGGEVIGHLPRPPELIKDGRALDGAIQDAIEQVLPKECQQFFFFDGLEIQTYASKQRPADIREAIERVLGIPEVRNLRADLAKVIDRWEDERDRHLEKNQEHHRLLDELRDLRTEEAGLRKDLEAERKTRDAISGLLIELEKRAAELETIKMEQERLRDLERLKDSKERSLLEQERQLDTAIHQASRQLALPILHRQVARLQTEVGTTDYRAVREGELQARKKILEEILDSMQCICERDVPTPVVRTLEQKIKDIEGMLARQPSRDRGAAALHERQNALMRIIGKLESAPVNMKQTLQLKQRLKLEIKDDLKVFPTQFGAWAFAAAYAMSKLAAKEQPPTPKKKEQLPEREVLEAELLTVLLESDNYIASTSGWEIITEPHHELQPNDSQIGKPGSQFVKYRVGGKRTGADSADDPQ